MSQILEKRHVTDSGRRRGVKPRKQRQKRGSVVGMGGGINHKGKEPLFKKVEGRNEEAFGEERIESLKKARVSLAQTLLFHL
jgi:hypothetical protein